MTFKSIQEKLNITKPEKDTVLIDFSEKLKINVYVSSINSKADAIFFIGRVDYEKSLYIVSGKSDGISDEEFTGEKIATGDDGIVIKKCPMNHFNRTVLQKHFPFTVAVPVGLGNSFGYGDRLGVANPGHVISLRGYNFKPIFAQQSIRELTRTIRRPEDVMDAAVWAVFQEGYKDGFGADADHLKTTGDIDLMVGAGYKTFTIDPSDFIVNGAEHLDRITLMKRVLDLSWKEFNEDSKDLIARYENKEFKLSNDFSIKPSIEEILAACLKYKRALIHIKNMHDYLKNTYPDYSNEIEVSIDETETVTTTFEHFFIVNELNIMKVDFVSLAPRFVGAFEKGIDYKGDIELFKTEYLKHLSISDHFGFYKLSFHSGSDKFTVYNAVASLRKGKIHIKTAGTSYLEALKVVAITEPDLFREILDFSAGLYEVEKKTYHVSADMKRIKPAKEYTDSELEGLFASNDVRQALHVTYGRVLTEKDASSNYTFRNRIYECLNKNEALHYEILVKHFHRHLDPFEKNSW